MPTTTTLPKQDYLSSATVSPVSEETKTEAQPTAKKNQKLITDTVIFIFDRTKYEPIGANTSVIFIMGREAITIDDGLNYKLKKDFEKAIAAYPKLSKAVTIIKPVQKGLKFDKQGYLVSLDSFNRQGVVDILKSITEYTIGWSLILEKMKLETENKGFLELINLRISELTRKKELADKPLDFNRKVIDLYAKKAYSAWDEVEDVNS